MVRESVREMSPAATLAALRNPYVTREVIEEILAVPEQMRSYQVRRHIAAHPRAPEVAALRLVGGLYWRDLVWVGRNARVRHTVRRAADQRLAERLPALALGERIAIARSGGAGVMARLLGAAEPEVVEALLDNPRLTEAALMPLLLSGTAGPDKLALVARHRRWGRRYEVRSALCRNPRSPVPLVLPLLPYLRKGDLRDIGSERRLAFAVRRRARLLLGLEPE